MLTLERIKEYAKTDRIALVNRDESLSFAALDARSDAFAAWLLRRFGDDRTPVILYGEKEIDFLCCLFGALKSGRAYVPIDRTVPAERAAQIVADVEPKVMINFGGFAPETGAVILDAAALAEILRSPPEAEPQRSHWVSGEDAAYILFTSGSTGKPKGVSITAANLEAFCKGLLPSYPAGEGGVILHQISYSFDVSGCAVYAGLARGMTLFTIDHTMTENIGVLFAWLKASGLTMWASTPSLAELCARSGAFDERLLPELRQFLFCGEVLTHALCETLAERFPKARVLNAYGPTEATVLVTEAEITEAMRRDARPIPIGRPIQGTKLRLVDGDGREITGDETPGELQILGASVGPGYWRRPDLTERSFFIDAATGLRGYRTGDLCYRRGDLFYYCGRTDNQLKLSGYRVELEDIERNLAALPGIARAAVVPVWKDEKVQYLAAFLLLRGPDGLSHLKRTIRLKRQLAERLPAYMIPRKLFAVEAFPLNVNGKIDKKALAKRLEEAT
ncbi:amino acid adenylation domain-containing protein [Harryflintia acetispora]|uniref:amino acid adenylation domain-containing protein n=1 Tax=Harryflintia acetispora TaxID=1849041 RepID=UPI0018973598|nr:amino acid adenylation domain-containing protein [Harryflintia acetispora]